MSTNIFLQSRKGLNRADSGNPEKSVCYNSDAMKTKHAVTSQRLLAAAKQRRVLVEFSRPRDTDERGSIELIAPDGFQFDTDLHGLVTEQQDNYSEGGLEPWGNVVAAAFEDLMNYPIRECPEDCVCRETTP